MPVFPVFLAALEKADIVGEWLKQNLWGIITTAGLVLLLIGQWVARSDGDFRQLGARVSVVEGRVETLTQMHSDERARLDPLYMNREMAAQQNTEVLRRLQGLEDQMRVLLQRTR